MVNGRVLEAANSCCVLCKLHMHTKLENGVQVPGNRQQVKSAFTSLYELQRHYRLENLCTEIQIVFWKYQTNLGILRRNYLKKKVKIMACTLLCWTVFHDTLGINPAGYKISQRQSWLLTGISAQNTFVLIVEMFNLRQNANLLQTER